MVCLDEALPLSGENRGFVLIHVWSPEGVRGFVNPPNREHGIIFNYEPIELIDERITT